MPIEILMPALSPTMKEGNVAKWLKKEGDKISAGDVIAEIETDKATMEVEAVDEGTLGKIIIPGGTENVAVNSLIALILEEGEEKSALDSYSSKTSPQTSKIQEKVLVKKEDKIVVATNDSVSSDQRLAASPIAKRIAAQNNIDITNISGTGPKGRIVKNDVLGSAKSGTSNQTRNSTEYRAVKNSNIRKIIAKRLVESKQTIPHFYLNIDLKIDKLLQLRKDLNEAAIHDVSGVPSYKISVNDLIIKAVAMALKKVPQANSSWSDDAILIYNNIDISVAVAVEDGLITPIIKNADQKSISDIANEMKSLIKKAKDGKLQPEEFQGGGFSISNLGMYGIDSFSAIVNPPQSCILAVGAGIEKPVIEDGQIKIANVMNVTLSCDHRSVDGAVGAEFLKALRKIIENPILMLIL